MNRRSYPACWRAAGLAVSLAAAACGGDSGSPSVPPARVPTPAPTPIPDPAPTPDLLLPDDPSAVILEVWVHGGLLPPHYSLNLPPVSWLTAGGTLYLPHEPSPAWPPPLLSTIVETRMTAAELDAILGRIVAAGLPDAAEEHIPEPSGGVPEVLTVELIFRDTAGEHVIRVEALYVELDTHADPRVPHLRALLDLLEPFAEASEHFAQYPPERLQVITVFDAPPQDPQDRDERPWPLPDPPQWDEDRPFSCRVVGGAVAVELIEIFATAFQTTRWVHAEERIQLLARPLFPGEAGCRE